MPIPDDARFGPECSPQSHKEDVAYDYDVQVKSLQYQADRGGYLAADETEGGSPELPARRVTASTRGSFTPAPKDALRPGGTESEDQSYNQ